MRAQDEQAAQDDEDEALQRTGDRIQHLLGELRSSTAPMAWARIEELVASLTTIYGTGLARTLAAFTSAGRIDAGARERLCEDPLVGSLLLLHGLHPVPIDERVALAVDRVKRAVGQAATGEIEIAPVDDAAMVRVRLSGDWRSSPLGWSAIEVALRRAIEDAAPDLASITIEGESLFSASPKGLVQIDLSRSRGRSSPEAGR
jgi:hypothetical protein